MSEGLLRFRSTVHLSGKTATGIRVPVGDYTYRSTIAPMGGEFWIPLSAEHRTGAGLAAGEEVSVAVELDTAPRELCSLYSPATSITTRNMELVRRFFNSDVFAAIEVKHSDRLRALRPGRPLP